MAKDWLKRILCFSAIAAGIGFGALAVNGVAFWIGFEHLGKASMFALRVFFFPASWATKATPVAENIAAWVIASFAWGIVISCVLGLVSKCVGGCTHHR